MSTQEKGTPLYNAPDDIGYRLIELPPDLEKALESDTPPSLTLHHTDTVALLSTPTQSYSLRQKNTSNALILLKPHHQQASLAGGGEEGFPSQEGMAIISEIHEFVELEPVKGGEKVAEKASVAKGKWHERFGKTR